MRDGTQGDSINPWGVRLFRTLQTVQPKPGPQQSAYDKWRDQTSAREEARLDRIHGAVGVIPTTLWIVLFFIAAVIFVFMLFFADRGERAVVQGMLIGSVVVGDGRADAAAERASTVRSTTASAGCNPSPWSGRCGWSTRP